jgi:hypothetical protein
VADDRELVAVPAIGGPVGRRRGRADQGQGRGSGHGDAQKLRTHNNSPRSKGVRILSDESEFRTAANVTVG